MSLASQRSGERDNLGDGHLTSATGSTRNRVPDPVANPSKEE
jgi:hypothetical protein